jgi:hypothetical protein
MCACHSLFMPNLPVNVKRPALVFCFWAALCVRMDSNSGIYMASRGKTPPCAGANVGYLSHAGGRDAWALEMRGRQG